MKFHSGRGHTDNSFVRHHKAKMIWLKMKVIGWSSFSTLWIMNMQNIRVASCAHWQLSSTDEGHMRSAAKCWIWNSKFWTFTKSIPRHREHQLRKFLVVTACSIRTTKSDPTWTITWINTKQTSRYFEIFVCTKQIIGYPSKNIIILEGCNEYRLVTASDIHALTDEQCLKAITLPITSYSNAPGYLLEVAEGRTRTQLLSCGNCRKQEAAHRCKKVVYCNKDCQKKAWKLHNCGKKKWRCFMLQRSGNMWHILWQFCVWLMDEC